MGLRSPTSMLPSSDDLRASRALLKYRPDNTTSVYQSVDQQMRSCVRIRRCSDSENGRVRGDPAGPVPIRPVAHGFPGFEMPASVRLGCASIRVAEEV